MRAGKLVAYRESPSQTGRLDRSVYIEASWLNLPIFSSLFCNMRKLILTITTKALPADQINCVGVMHLDKEHVQLRFGIRKSHILRIVVQHRANLAVL